MSLKLITGRANAGKTGVVLADALAALRRGQTPTLVVPRLADVRRLEQELSAKAPIGVRVVTSRGLAEELWRLHGDGRRFVGQATRSAIVRSVIGGTEDTPLSASVRSPGFERLLGEIVQSSSPGGEDPREVPAEDRFEPSALVLQLVSRYRAALSESGLIEAGWASRLMASVLPFLGGPYGFIRFDSYSPADVDMVGALSLNNEVSVALTWEKDFPPTEANSQFATRLLDRASEHQLVEPCGDRCEIGSLAESLFGGQGALTATGSVVVGVAAGMEAEAALVARAAAEVVAAGTLPERVVVVFGRLARRVSAIENAMAAEGLVGEFEFGAVATQAPFGRALAALLRLVLRSGDRTDALQFLQGPFSDADGDRVHALDSAWRRRRQGEDPERIIRDIIKLEGSTGTCMRLAVALSGQRIDALTAMKWQELADSLLSQAFKASAASEHVLDAGAHGAFVRAVGEMASVAGTPFGPADVLAMLPSLSFTVQTAETAGRIQLTEASRLGSRRFDTVIIAGMTEREFSAGPSDSFAESIGSRVNEIEGRTQDAVARLRLYSLITRARSALYMVRQSVDSDGSQQQPSALWEQVLDVYRSPESEIGAFPDGGPRQLVISSGELLAFAPVFTASRREQRQRRPGEGAPCLRRLERSGIDAQSAETLVSARGAVSATEVEAYLKCPYQWFYGRVLRPQSMDAHMGAAEMGNRSHRLIAEFYAALEETGIPRVTHEGLGEALKLFDEVAEGTEGSMMMAQGVAEQLDAARARLWARQVVVDDAILLPGFEPRGHEIVFGEDSPFEFAGVSMRGRIDRVDIGPGGIVVTDYKSSSRVVGYPGFEKAGHVQAVIYAAAAGSIFEGDVVASVYRSLRSRSVRGFWRSDLAQMPPEACEKDALGADEFETLCSQTERAVASAVEGMRAGRIPRKPMVVGACAYCEVAPVCEGARA